MSNAARHWIGLVVGLAAAPLLYVALAYVVKYQVRDSRDFATDTDYLLTSGLMAAVAVLVALLVSSRLSPLASLVPAVFFLAIGVPHAVSRTYTLDESAVRALTADLRLPMLVHSGPGGFLLFLGVALLVASLFPTRWAPRVVQNGGRHAPGYTPPSPDAAPPPLQWDEPATQPPSSFGGPAQPLSRPYDPFVTPERRNDPPDWAQPPHYDR